MSLSNIISRFINVVIKGNVCPRCGSEELKKLYYDERLKKYVYQCKCGTRCY